MVFGTVSLFRTRKKVSAPLVTFILRCRTCSQEEKGTDMNLNVKGLFSQIHVITADVGKDLPLE